MTFISRRPPEPAAGRSFGQQDISLLGWILFIMALCVQLVGPLLLWLISRLFPTLAQAPWYLPLSSILLPMLLGYPLFFLLIRRIPAPAFPHRRRMPPKEFLSALVTAFGLSYLMNILTQLFAGWFSRQTGYMPQNPLLGLETGLPAPLLLFLTVGAAPVLEELTFRGMVLPRLRQWGELFGIVCTALLFALYHGNLSQFFYSFAVGLVLGYAASRYSLRYSIALHVCLNLPGALVLSFIDLSAFEQMAASPAGSLSSPENLLPLLFSLFLSLFMFITIAGAIVILAGRCRDFHLPRSEDGLPERVKYQLFFCSTGIALFISMHVLLIALSLFL
jgi:membrane protease YdiL (CAAX protease family)